MTRERGEELANMFKDNYELAKKMGADNAKLALVVALLYTLDDMPMALRDKRRDSMTFEELNEDQKTQVKQQLMISLANDGVFIANMRRWHPDDYPPGEGERGPSWGELSDANDLVPDEVVAQDGVSYVVEDFGGGDGNGHC